MWKKSKITDQTATGQGGTENQPPKKKGIKRRSKVPGVMITQYMEELPEGKTTPDFTRKPIALTIQEGKLAIFKAIVIGEPNPTVSWKRAKGEMNDPHKFQNKYDPVTNEHTLEIPKVRGEEADTYKCYAVNEYGKAVCTVILNVIEVGFKKNKQLQKTADLEDPAEFRNKLKKSVGKTVVEKKEGEIDESVWDLLLSAHKKDYEHICSEYGVTDFRGMLKKLTAMKIKREQEQAMFIQHISNLKHIEVKSENSACFELDLELKDPRSRILLYKDGVMVPYSKDMDSEVKHYLKQVGKKYVFTVKNLNPEDAGIYQLDVEGVNVFSTDFKISPVDFLVKIQEVKAAEREDAIFECVTSIPINQILWTLKNNPLTNSDKYEITVSEDKLIHCLRVIDCMPLDAGIYSAVAGIKSCSAWLVVEANKDPAMKGKRIARKTTQAGGSGADLSKIAAEQQDKNKKDTEDSMEASKRAEAEMRWGDAAAAKAEADAVLAASRAAAAARAATTAEAAEAAVLAAKAKNVQEDAKAHADAAAAAAAAKARAAEAAEAALLAAKEKKLQEDAKAQADAAAAAAAAKARADAADEAALLAAKEKKLQEDAKAHADAAAAAAAAKARAAEAAEAALLAAKEKKLQEDAKAQADAAAAAAAAKARAAEAALLAAKEKKLQEDAKAQADAAAAAAAAKARADEAAEAALLAAKEKKLQEYAKAQADAAAAAAAAKARAAEAAEAALLAAKEKKLQEDAKAQADAAAAAAAAKARADAAAAAAAAKARADAAAAAAAAKSQAEAEVNAKKLAEARAKEACLSAKDIAKAGAAATAMLTENLAASNGLGLGLDTKSASLGGSANLAEGAVAEGFSYGLAGGVSPAGDAGIAGGASIAGGAGDVSGGRGLGQAADDALMKEGADDGAKSKKHAKTDVADTVKVIVPEPSTPEVAPVKQIAQPKQSTEQLEKVDMGPAKGTAEEQLKQDKKHTHVRQGPLLPDTVIVGGNHPGNPSSNPGHNPSGKAGQKQGSNAGHSPSGNQGLEKGSNPGHYLSSNLCHDPSGNQDNNPEGNPSETAGGNFSKSEGSEGVPADSEATEGTKDESDEAGKRSGLTRQGPLLLEETVDPGVHFSGGLEDCRTIVGEAAELVCKLSSVECNGLWYKDGKEISDSTEGISISKDGATHKLKIHKVSEEFAGKYKFEADGRKTEAMIIVEDPPRFTSEELEEFTKPRVVKANQKAEFKIPYIGREATKIQWYKEGEELTPDSNCKIETTESYSRLSLSKLQRKDTGEIKIKIKNEFGTVEATSNLIVLDKPTPPLGPLEIVEASSNCIEIKWRPSKDNGGCPITNYILERNQVGRNTWKKIGQIPGEAHYKDTDVDHGRKYCYRIRAETSEGISELMQTEDIQAGTKAYPGPLSAPKVISAIKDCITLSWTPPANTGGSNILGYNLEKRKKGSNIWSLVHPPEEPIKTKKYACKDVIEGIEYEFRVSAVNISGAGEPSPSSETVFARDPKKPPGKVIDLKVTGSTYNTLSLAWMKPKEVPGEHAEAKGYFVEIRPAESTEWICCNSNAIIMNSYTIKRLKAMAMYWVRVIAVNEGGAGEPNEMNNYILAIPPPVRPKFTDTKINSFMIIKAGNAGRFSINFVASPWPEVIWLKDGIPVSKRVTISNADGCSQILIPSAERSDSGIYTIIVKNIVAQETFSVEIRVTDEPKPPGPVELDVNVPGTVTITWAASADEKRDDRLHYMVTKRDSVKQTWHTVADRIFNNRFTACNIIPGREYQFRVYAKNDMGQSAPSESPKWFITEKKEKHILTLPETKPCNLEEPPKFLVPLKLHTAPQGYECYMSCAIKGNPTPYVTWYHNNVNLNTDSNYYITNTCGVCSMLILRVTPSNTGEYKVIAENPLGRAECSTTLTVRE